MDIIGFIDCYSMLGVKKDSTNEDVIENYLEILKHINKKLNTSLNDNYKKLIKKEKIDLDISFIILTTPEIKEKYDNIYDSRFDATLRANNKMDTNYEYSIKKKESYGKFTRLYDTYKDVIKSKYNLLNSKDNIALKDIDLSSVQYKKVR